MDPARRAPTYEDLLALPEGERAEILDGELVAEPAPLPEHSRAQGALRHFIGGPFDDDDGHGGPGGWWILIEVDVRLGDDVVRPDLCGWHRTKLPSPWKQRPIEVVPDWICEVVSPSNAARDRLVKRRIYAAQGVGHFWLVDPRERILEAARLQQPHWLEVGTYGDGDKARIEPFGELELDVGRLFPPR